MGGTTAGKAAKKRKSGTEVVVVSNETSSADTSESSSEIRKTTTVIPKKQSKKSPKASESIDPFKYFVSRSELQNSIHENDFNQFDGYNNNWEDYLSNNPSYKIKVTAKEAMALSNPLNAKWKEECTGDNICREIYAGYREGVTCPTKSVYPYTNNDKLLNDLTKLLSFKHTMQAKLQRHQMGQP